MSERRKSTRFGGEPPPKRRKSVTPAAPAKPPAKSKASAAVVHLSAAEPEVEEGLPRKLKDGAPLPTGFEPQAKDLPARQFQTIAQRHVNCPWRSLMACIANKHSGVLAASIERSRSRWLTDGLFEKYWTKPKKKNQGDSSNPAKDTMSKLGVCSMTIEPHVFEITLYSVREPQSSYTFLPPVSQPSLSGQGSAYGSPYSNSATSTPATPVATHESKAPPTTPSPAAPPLSREGFSQFSSQTKPGPGRPRSVQAPLPPAPAALPAPIPPNDTGTDPVIQMLASRAAMDHNLKTLMKVVAQGDATQDQLSVFQQHIDELNDIIQSQKNGLPGNSGGRGGPNLPAAMGPPASNANPTVPYNNYQSQPPGVKAEPMSRYYSQPPQYLKSKAPAPMRQDISAIVFDFGSGGTGDRYLLPKLSIVELLPGNTQALLSFLRTSKGAMVPGGRYKDSVEYYEPVTIRLSSNNPRALELLSRVVTAAEEVRKYMSDVMSKMTLANHVYLATRLPRANEDDKGESAESAGHVDMDMPMTTYPAPNSLFPIDPESKE